MSRPRVRVFTSVYWGATHIICVRTNVNRGFGWLDKIEALALADRSHYPPIRIESGGGCNFGLPYLLSPQPFDGCMYSDGKMLPPPSLDANATNWAFGEVLKMGF
jgi:hypothetical protein